MEDQIHALRKSNQMSTQTEITYERGERVPSDRELVKGLVAAVVPLVLHQLSLPFLVSPPYQSSQLVLSVHKKQLIGKLVLDICLC